MYVVSCTAAHGVLCARTAHLACATCHPAVLNFKKGSTQRKVFHYTTYSLAGLVPAGVFLGGGVATAADVVLAVAIPLHSHIGMRSVIMDYVKPDSVQRAAIVASAAFSALMAAGLFKLSLGDVGIIEGTKMMWRAAPAKAE